MKYNDQSLYMAKVKNLLTKKTQFFDVFAASIIEAVRSAEEIGALAFDTRSVEVVACGKASKPVKLADK
jgi:hypothetical protein